MRTPPPKELVLTQWGPALSAMELEYLRTSADAIELLLKHYQQQEAKGSEAAPPAVLEAIGERRAVLERWQAELLEAKSR